MAELSIDIALNNSLSGDARDVFARASRNAKQKCKNDSEVSNERLALGARERVTGTFAPGKSRSRAGN
jgi:hypothetical protein